MEMLVRSILYLALFLLLACDPGNPDLSKAKIPLSHRRIVNSFGDTVYSGKSFKIAGRKIPRESLAAPLNIPISKEPARRKVNSSNFPLPNRKTISLKGRGKFFIPGKKGTPFPYRAKVKSWQVLADIPRPTQISPLTANQSAIFDCRELGTEQGMPSAGIYSIAQAKDGLLWFGSYGDGLISFDGNRVTQFKEKDGLFHNQIFSNLVDRKGNIWIGTWGGVVTKYDGEVFTHYQFEDGAFGKVLSLAEDSQGNLWFGGMGTICFDPETEETLYFRLDHGLFEQMGMYQNSIETILEDRRGRLWFGSKGGFSILHPKTDSSDLKIISYDNFGRYSFGRLSQLYEDSKGGIWLVGEGACMVLEGENFKALYTDNNDLPKNFYSVTEDLDGNIWLGSYKDGLFKLGPEELTKYTTNEGLTNNRIKRVFADEVGLLWLATLPGGVNRIDPKGFHHLSQKNGLSRDGVSPITEDSNGDLWFGIGVFNTYSAGLNRYDGEYIYDYQLDNGLIHPGVNSIIEDQEKNIWFGSPIAFSRLDPKKKIFTHFQVGSGLSNFPVWSLLKGNGDKVWFGAQDGIILYQGNTGDFLHYTRKEGLPVAHILSIAKDKSENLWLGSWEYGLIKFKPQLENDSAEIQMYSLEDGLADNRVSAIHVDKNNHLWIGMEGGGLNFFDGENFKTINEDMGFLDNKVWSIVEDKQGRIWMSTDKGICLFSPITSEKKLIEEPFVSGYEYREFGHDDGLKNLNFSLGNAYHDSKNRIWWGTEKGLIFLNLNTFEIPTKAPQHIDLSFIEINGEYIGFRALKDSLYKSEIEFGEEVDQSFDSLARFKNYPINPVFPYQLNHLRFHFSAVDWVAPHKIKFSYRLLGQEKGWSTPSNIFSADYRNLSYGSYTLQLKAYGEAQKWGEVFEYSFQITPPWWYSWWAYVIYGVLFFSLLGGVILYEIRRFNLKTESERLKELNFTKSKLYGNITHEFRTPLSIILGLVENIQKEKNEGKEEEDLKAIYRNAQQLLKLVNQMLDLSKIEAGELSLKPEQRDIIKYLKFIVESFTSFAESQNTGLHFIDNLSELYMDIDPTQLMHIMSNLISNAIKFSPPDKHVYVSSEIQKRDGMDRLLIKVRDSGIGIPEESLPYIFDRFYQVDDTSTRKGEGTGIGLTLSKELALLMGGNISVESIIGRGSEFSLSLPIKREYQKPKFETNPHAIFDVQSTGFTIPSYKEKVPNDTLMLIVEDNPDLINYLVSSFSPYYQIEVAFNGQQGIDKALQLLPDIIVTDVMMPKKDGFELCNTLKNNQLSSHIPILMLTAKADVESRLTAFQKGADAYLAKPFLQNELIVRIDSMLKQRERLHTYYLEHQGLKEINHLNSEKNPEIESENKFLKRVRIEIEKHLDDSSFGVEQLSFSLAISPSHLFRKLKALTGLNTNQYIRSVKLKEAKRFLKDSEMNIAEVAYSIGFSDPQYFSRVFKKEVGMSPRDFRSMD